MWQQQCPQIEEVKTASRELAREMKAAVLDQGLFKLKSFKRCGLEMEDGLLLGNGMSCWAGGGLMQIPV